MEERELEGSLVIATWNRPSVVERTVRHISGILPDDWEILVVDDGSEPPLDPATIPRARLIRNETNLGRGEARNRGGAEARGRILAFMDDDIFPLSSCLSRLTRHVGEYGVWVAAYERRSAAAVDPETIRDEAVPDAGPRDVHLATSQLLVTRHETFAALGGFPTDISRLVDYELSLRGRVNGHRLLRDMGAHIVHEDIHHSFRAVCLREHDWLSLLPKVWSKHLPEPPGPDEVGYAWFWGNLRSRWWPIRWLGRLLQLSWLWAGYVRLIPKRRPRPDALARLLFRVAAVRGSMLGMRRLDPAYRTLMLRQEVSESE